ncbi:MAG: hypothetical protein H6617_03695 [Bdellovibrionaceae bacterium]|nr:hypothetical protein [Pseudobdellovibrionaceae bacterium]
MRKLLLILLLIATTAEARLRRTGFEAIRPLGMGNAFLALADDQNMLWYNPAALARVQGVHAHLLDLTLGVDSFDTLSRLLDSILEGNFDANIRTDIQYTRMNAANTFITPYFGVSLFADSATFMDLQNLSSEAVDILSKNDVGAIIGVGLPIGKNFSLGFSVRLFQRFGIDEYLTPLELLTKLGGIPSGDFLDAVFTVLQDDITTGYAFGVNLGALFTVPFTPKEMKWTIGATFDDFGNTSFTAFSGTNAPNTIPATLNFGTAFQYQLSRSNTLNLAFDWRDSLGSDPLFKRLHAGIEMRFPGVSLRAGVYQGRPTAGVSFEALPHTRINFTTYGVELGDSIWTREHRWFCLAQAIVVPPF